MMRCITAICPAGPPKDSAATRSQTRSASPKETPCAGTDRGGAVRETCVMARPSPEQLHRTLGRLPGIMSARHVASIESSLAQDLRRLAANVEAVDAECDDRLGLRQLADPFVHPLGITPGGACHDVLCPGAVVPRPRIDDLDRLAGFDHCPYFLHCHGWEVRPLLLHQLRRGFDLDRVTVTSLHRIPVDIAHERCNVGGGIGSEIQ